MRLLVLSLVLLLAVSSCDGSRRRSRRRGGGGKKLDPMVAKAIKTIWSLEEKQRPKYGSDYEICFQGHLDRQHGKDMSTKPFVCKLDHKVLERPTVKALSALWDNYNRVDGQPEDITPEEVKENNKFLDLVMESEIMKEVHATLTNKKKADPDPAKFRETLYRLWFGAYARRSSSSIKDSSGFEHVFMGEVNNYKHTIGGFHNWLHLWYEEQHHHLNYYGYFVKSQSPLIQTLRFNWYGTMKPIGSCFVGTSPEFEMSLYTLIYMMGYSKAHFDLGGTKVMITCWPTGDKRHIGTCYPDPE